ncbi:GAF domain-containing sensor histidine kinase [Wenxinia saemankumensis]|uniref:histidine kinase n=1 Tax=Wenxinia saemankumensis TaxID=1447782 RepID=A0A1M6AE51_9RHOB|nr:GAF domain-containing sensor histidine kinase [Wenxinia saemankumensis]SHI34834.1 Signal transduction histidine kinase [Wenxinia saemankumensis]
MNQAVIRFPFPPDEVARLQAIRPVLGPKPFHDPVIAGIVERTRDLLGSPAALASVVEIDHQWFLASTGINVGSTPRSHSLCSRTILSDRPLILTDTLSHEDFSTHPAVTDDPHVRFYAGAPIILRSGSAVGSLCGIDMRPREAPSPEAVAELVGLAAEIARHLDARHERMSASPDAPGPMADDPRNEFLALVGHELRTPLTVMQGNALLLRRRLAGEQERRMIDAIAASGRHLHEMIERVIYFSGLGSERPLLVEDRHPVAELIGSAAAPAAAILGDTRRRLTVSGASGEASVLVDRDQYGLAVSSIISNAAVHGAGDVDVRIDRSTDRGLRVTILDDGPGLPRGVLDGADRPFVVGERLNTRMRGGLGLGLPLARKLMENHGGELSSGFEEGRAYVALTLPAWRGG